MAGMGPSASSESLQAIQTGRSGQYTKWLCCHSDRPQQAEEVDRQEPREVQQNKEARLDNLQGFLPISPVLWFCKPEQDKMKEEKKKKKVKNTIFLFSLH